MPIVELFNASIRKAVKEQNEFRTSWVKDDDVDKLASMYWAEDAEYQEAKELCMMGDDPFSFVSEAGDKAYLYMRICDHTDNNPPIEIEADIARTYAECVELGVDMIRSAFFKVWRNDIKYPLMISRNGFTFQETQELSKQQYRLMGGEECFLFAYMMLAEQLEHV